MMRILLIARNVVRAILSRHAVYLWGAAVLLMFLRAAPAVFMRRQDEAMLRFIRANSISGALSMWAIACLGAAIFLGAVVVTSDMTTRTIATVLARPVRRWEFMAGKWLGVTTFVLLTLALGIGIGLGIARYLGIEVDHAALRAAVAQTAVASLLFAAVTVALGTFGSAGLAIAMTLFLAFMPNLIDVLRRDDQSGTRRAIGAALDYATPAQYRDHYNAVAWAPFPGRPGPRMPGAVFQRPVVDYAAERPTLAGNLGYAAVYFLLGCVAFTRRDLPLG